MKKICFVTTVAETIRAFFLKFAKYLYETGEFDVSFICKPDEMLMDIMPQYIHMFPIHMERGISIGGLKAMWQMKSIFDKEKFDIVQYSTPNASCYASIATWLSKVPVRLYCQGGIVYVGFSGLKRKIFKLEEKMVCRLSTWIESVSRSNLVFCYSEGLYPENKGSVVWNGSACGVDLTKFDYDKKAAYNCEIRRKYNIPRDAVVFGFIGRITGDKGVNELFRASKQLLQKYKNVRLFIVGKVEKADSIEEDLYQWAQECGQVIFGGYTLVAEQYIASMDCFVLPSYREGFGMTVVEAEAMGVPVIITNIPGPIDGMIENKTGLIVRVKDADALLDAMETLINHKELRTEFGQNGIAYIRQNFEQVKLFEKMYKDRLELLENHGRRALQL